MRNERFDWWNDEYPEKELAFQALLELAKELKRQPTSEDVGADERTSKYQVVFVSCWGSVRRACLDVGAYLRSHPKEAAGMDDSIWRCDGCSITVIPMSARIQVKKTEDGKIVSSWYGNGKKKPPRQIDIKPVVGAGKDLGESISDKHKQEVQKQVIEQVLQAALKEVVEQQIKEQGGSSMAVPRKYTDRQLLTMLRDFHLEQGRFPTQTELNQGPANYAMMWKYVGNVSTWPAALEREFGPDWMKPPEEGGLEELSGRAGAGEDAEKPVDEPDGAAGGAGDELAEAGGESAGIEGAALLDVRLVGTYELTVIVDGERKQLKLSFGEQ